MPDQPTPRQPAYFSCEGSPAPDCAALDPLQLLRLDALTAELSAAMPRQEGDEDESADDEDDLADRIDAVEERLARLEAAVGGAGPQGPASIAESIGRIADALAPAPADVVGSPYVARLLGCTVTWVSEMARQGRIPKHCMVAGTGKGKPWKFLRRHIDRWIACR